MSEPLHPRNRRERIEKFWEPIMVAAVVLTLIALLVENFLSPTFALAVNSAIWLIFTLEYVTVLAACRTRSEVKRWMRRAWVSPLIIIGSFPLLPNSLQSVRFLRLFRLGQVLTVSRLFHYLDRYFRPHPLFFTTTAVAVVITLGANAMHQAEPDKTPDLASAYWWAVETVTTVGYGDIIPETPTGRAVGMVLMLLGPAVAGAFSAGLASWLITRARAEKDLHAVRLTREVGEMRKELGEIRALLQRTLPETGVPGPGAET